MPTVDWSHILAFTVSPLELFIRGTLTYLFLFLLFRFVVRRDTGALGISDLLVLVIIADASQNAMSGEYKSVADGFVLISTIIGWNIVLNYLSYRYALLRRFLLPSTLFLVRDGIKQERNLKRQMISDEELFAMLREQQVEDVSEVESAYLEPDGQVSVIKKKKPAEAKKSENRHKDF